MRWANYDAVHRDQIIYLDLHLLLCRYFHDLLSHGYM